MSNISNNKRNIIKQIIYRSSKRGNKEMDLIFTKFINKFFDKITYSTSLTNEELQELIIIIEYDDNLLYKYYLNINLIENDPNKNILIKLLS